MSTVGVTKTHTLNSLLDSKVLMHPISSKSNSILLDNIPQKFYAREFLTEFYSKFGVVIKIDINDGLSNSAVITFVNHDSAEDAVQNGGILEDGEETGLNNIL